MYKPIPIVSVSLFLFTIAPAIAEGPDPGTADETATAVESVVTGHELDAATAHFQADLTAKLDAQLSAQLTRQIDEASARLERRERLAMGYPADAADATDTAVANSMVCTAASGMLECTVVANPDSDSNSAVASVR